MLYKARFIGGSVCKWSEHWAVVLVLKGCSHLLQRLVFVLRVLSYLLCDVRKC